MLRDGGFEKELAAWSDWRSNSSVVEEPYGSETEESSFSVGKRVNDG
jgi:hypothetical protein